jgi:hypothetical protein
MNATKQQARWEYFGPHSREVCDSNGRAVCKVAASAPDNTGPFIAAAPDLYAALEALCRQEDWEGEDIPPDSPVGMARAALARARGEVR